jgi:hypothetical protein
VSSTTCRSGEIDGRPASRSGVHAKTIADAVASVAATARRGTKTSWIVDRPDAPLLRADHDKINSS